MLEIINQRYMQLLFEISKKPRNISELAKKQELTVSVTSTLISRWATEGVVFKDRTDGGRGKEIIITLTEYGDAQIKLLKELFRNYKKKKSGKFEKAEILIPITPELEKLKAKEVQNDK